MHRLVPDFILEQFAAGSVTGNFPAAGLFVDISGFSSVTDDLMVHGPHGAEVLATLMRTVFEPLVQSCYEQGGFITTFAGDAFTALFPTEATTADATGRALAAAWRIQEHMRAEAEQTTTYGTYSLAAKVGMAWGDADWGIVSTDDGARAVFYFRGAAIEDSAAAEHFAGPGDIILTSDFYDGVKAQVRADAVAGENGSVEHHRLLTIIEPLPAPQAVELPAPQLDLLERFHPQALLTQAYSGEFRHVVNLFISLPTVRTETQLAVFMRSLFALQSRYGGLLNRLDFGDKGSNLLLFWGAPVAHENDVERALNLTLDLQTQTSIPIKAGLTYQIAHAGFVGSPLREDYTCFGRGVNLAARFMTHAGRGEIWVDEAVARRAENRFELEFEGSMAFKGFAENQRVYVLYERKEELADVFEGELVGREAELARLLDFASPLEEGGYAGVMVIRGEAGIGKSRLVHAFRSELTSSVPADSLGLSWFLCQTDEVLRDSLSSFRYWLRRYFGQSEVQAEARNKRSFNRTLDRLVDATEDAELAGELDRTRSFLGALLGLRWPDSLYEELDPEGRYENTLIGLICLLQAESMRRPVILQLEDAQWLDVDSKGLLARLVRTLTADRNREYPIALIITARPSGRGPLLGEDLAYQEIELGQLSRESLARLAERQLNDPAAPALLSLLADRAEGNPFFAEQILRYLMDGDRLRRGDDGWEPINAAESSVVPSDVSALLIARLDQLTQQVKEVVQTAAILGREFEVKLLTQMLLEDDMLSRKVAQAEEAAIWSALTELTYLFKHALLRDAAYRMQVQTRRQSLHRLAVHALEHVYATDLDVHYGELAYHSEQAGRDEKALHYLRLAGDAARDAYQNSQAVDYYGRGMKLLPDDELETRWDLLQAREQVEDLLGRRGAQREDLQALLTLAEQLADENKSAMVALRWSELAINTADYDAAITWARRAIDLAQAGEDAGTEAAGHRFWGVALREQGAFDDARVQFELAREQAQAAGAQRVWARSLHDLGGVSRVQRDYTGARSYHEQALRIYRNAGDRRGEALCLRSLAILANHVGDDGSARVCVDQALRIAREIGDRQQESDCYNTLANVATNDGDLAGAQAYLVHALGLYRQLGDRAWEGLCLTNLGYLAWEQGQYAAAQSFLENALDIQREIGHKWDESLSLENLGMVNRDVGDHRRAQAYLWQGLDISREIGLREREGAILNELGIVATDLKDYISAQALFEEALALRREAGLTHHLAETLAGLADISRYQGLHSRARAHIEDVLEYIEAGPELLGAERPFRVHLICYQVLTWLGDDRALPVLRRMYELLHTRASKIPDEETRRSYIENVVTRRAIVREFGRVFGN